MRSEHNPTRKRGNLQELVPGSRCGLGFRRWTERNNSHESVLDQRAKPSTKMVQQVRVEANPDGTGQGSELNAPRVAIYDS